MGKVWTVKDAKLATFWQIIRSRRLAIILLLLLVALTALGASLPQQDREGPTAYAQWAQDHPILAYIATSLGLNALYSSWWFLALFALLYANTVACTLPQLRNAFRQTLRDNYRWTSRQSSTWFTNAHEEALGGEGSTTARTIKVNRDPSSALAILAKVLAQRHYRVWPTDDGQALFATKGTTSAWGSPIFHLGLVIILTGAAITGLFRFSGYTELGEGQGFIESEQSYLQQSQGPLFGRELLLGPLRLSLGSHQQFSVRLDRFTAIGSNWSPNIPSDLISEVTIIENGKEIAKGTVGINRGLEHRGITLYPTTNFGLAPLFELRLPNGQVETGLVNLARRGLHRYENSLYLPGTIFRMTVAAESDGENVEVKVYERRILIFSGEIAPGQTIDIDGAKLTYIALRQWTGLRVVYEPGTIVLYIGFATTVLGLALSILVVRREIRARASFAPNGAMLAVKSGARRLRALAALELDDIAADLYKAEQQDEMRVKVEPFS